MSWIKILTENVNLEFYTLLQGKARLQKNRIKNSFLIYKLMAVGKCKKMFILAPRETEKSSKTKCAQCCRTPCVVV